MDHDGGSDQTTKAELLGWLDAKRRHIATQVEAMPAEARTRSYVPSGWTPRGLLRHLTLDVERFWLRAVVAGESVDLPEGYAGWLAPDDQSDDDLLEAYAAECALGNEIVAGLELDAAPRWWFDDSPMYSTVREVLLHVLVETATHAGHLDVSRELADGGQRLVLDTPD